MNNIEKNAISVIIPVRNSERTIVKSVESTLKQLSAHDHILICDDDSQDDTWSILYERYKRNKRVTLIRNHQQMGVAGTLNKLLESVKSELVVRIDADDFCLPGRISSQRRALEKVDFSFMGGVVLTKFLGMPMMLPTSPFQIPSEAAKFALIVTNPFFHPGASFRLAAVRALGGYKDVPAQDYDLWLRAASAGYVLQKEAGWGIVYRSHSAQVSKEYGQKLRELNEHDCNLVNRRLGLAKQLGLIGEDLSSVTSQARAKLRDMDFFFQLKRWA